MRVERMVRTVPGRDVPGIERHAALLVLDIDLHEPLEVGSQTVAAKQDGPAVRT